MNLKTRQYQCYKINFLRTAMLLLLSIGYLFSFSQQKPYVDTTETDSAYEDDDVVIADTTGNYQDSIDRAEYNYYNYLSFWPEDTFNLRQVPDSVVKALQAEDDFWYANKDFKKKTNTSEPRNNNFWQWLARQKWYGFVTWGIIIGGFLAVLIWFLASSNVGIFRRSSKRVADAETESENIFEINYQQEIDKAVKEGNFRLGVRLLFLQALKNLSERNIIQYKQGRTNFDYLLQLNNTSYYKNFFRVTRHFEYAWYGGFTISPDLFTSIKNDFQVFNNQLS